MSLLSPLAAMLIALGSPHGAGDDGVARQAAVPSEAPLGAAPLVGRGSIWSSDAASAGKVPIARQVRIERRVIMRITPQPGNSRRGFLSQLPRQTAPRVVERPHGECVDAGEIGPIRHVDANYLQSWLTGKHWGDWRNSYCH